MSESKQWEKVAATMNKVVGRWGTPEELKELRGVFKHEDEILPEGYTQIWIPNDLNIYASCIGYKGIDEEGNCVLVAGWRNPFGDGVCVHLPGDEYKYWCELPAFTEQMKSLREQILENGAPAKYTYPEKETKDE